MKAVKKSMQKIMVVLDSKPIKQHMDEGGNGHWKAKPESIMQCSYIVSTYNSRAKTMPALEHGEAYFVGEISGVTTMPDGRRLVNISRYASINVPGVWQPSGSTPIHYVARDKVEIDFDDLPWIEWRDQSKQGFELGGISPEQAKIGLSITFGVKPEQIEITIKA